MDGINSPIVHTFVRALAGIGLVYAIPVALRLWSYTWVYFLRPSSLSKYALPNAYALVTGASDGIGRGLAHELASRGFNVVLHGRSPAKLEKVKASIEASYPSRKIRIVLADAADSPNIHASVAAIATELRESLDGPLTVLVNNCGGIQPLRRKFLTFREMTPTEIDGVIDLNARFHAQLTRALMPQIFAEEGYGAGASQRPGLIMYTGSLGGVFPGPWLSTYSPSKAFGNVFMMSLGRELKATSPHVESIGILVGKVTDTAHFKTKPTLFGPESRTMAKSALDRVGCGRLNLIGHWSHAAQFFLLQVMPESWQTKLITDAMRLEVASTLQKAKET